MTLAGTLSLAAGGGGAFSAVTVAGAGLTLQGGTVSLNGSDTLAFSGTQTLAGSGTVILSDLDSITASGAGNKLTIAAGITVQGGESSSINVGTATLDNFGTISGNETSGPLTVTSTSTTTNWLNDGTIQAVNGGSIILAGSWTNDAPNAADTPPTNPQILASGGTVNLNGSWSNSGTLNLSSSGTINLGGSSMTLASIGTVNRTPITAGTLSLTGTLDLTGQTLDSTDGIWTLGGGTILDTNSMGDPLGGVITATLRTASGTTSTLQDIKLGGMLNFVGSAAIKVAGAGLTLQGGSISENGSDSLIFNGTQTLAGSGTVNLNDVDSITDNGTGNTLTIAQGITVNGGNSSSINVGSASLDNKGIINDAGRNGDDPLTITGTNWVNEGTIQSNSAVSGVVVVLTGSWTNSTTGQVDAGGGTISLNGSWSSSGTLNLTGGTINLGGSSMTLASIGTLNRTPTLSTGTVVLTGTLDLTGQTLDNSTHNWVLGGGTILDTNPTGDPLGGIITGTIQTIPITTSTLQDVKLAGTLFLPSGGGGHGSASM